MSIQIMEAIIPAISSINDKGLFSLLFVLFVFHRQIYFYYYSNYAEYPHSNYSTLIRNLFFDHLICF